MYAGKSIVGVLTCRGGEHRGSRSQAGTGDPSCACRRRSGRAARSTLRTTKLHLSPALPTHRVHENTGTRAVPPPPTALQALRFTTATPRRNPQQRTSEDGNTDRRRRSADVIGATAPKRGAPQPMRRHAADDVFLEGGRFVFFFAPPPRREQLLRRPGSPATPEGCETHAVWGTKKPARRNNACCSERRRCARVRHTRM
ncbi:hypothetical protein HPB50_023229 [Hyalomma asiaticum]|uniref:Uncharacterized protein n=1 Tax=Hyalomma asiaticum TaxID=266040 RepID=A0ACB7SSP1_HYAAI|nr:hypothetical protein HPB50_023229 [Hyalomma asiaticum]